MTTFVVDTDVVSYSFRNDPLYPPYKSLLRHAETIVSFATYVEAMIGAKKKGWGDRRINELQDFILRHFRVIDTTIEISDIWTELMIQARDKGENLHIYDGWIAATAVFLDVPLVSNNRKDFDYLDGLQLISFAPV